MPTAPNQHPMHPSSPNLPTPVASFPAGLGNVYLFAIFNALSFQVVLGSPMVLYAKSLGASATGLGIITGMMPLLVIFQIPAAHYVDRIGYKRFVSAGWGIRVCFIFGMALVPITYGFIDPTARLGLILMRRVAAIVQDRQIDRRIGAGFQRIDLGQRPVLVLPPLNRQRRDAQNAPHVDITANPDPTALEKFVAAESPWRRMLFIFLPTLSLVSAMRERSAYRHRTIATTAQPVEVEDLWSKDRAAYPSGLASLALHLLFVGAILIPSYFVLQTPAMTTTSVMMLHDKPLILNMPKLEKSSGGGGGGGGGGGY